MLFRPPGGPAARARAEEIADMADEVTRSEAAAREATEAVARRSYARLVTVLAARTRDVAGAEDALSSAFVAALVDWPANGVPRNPEGWLLTVARRKWIDADRRRRSADEAADQLRLVAEEAEAAAARASEALGGCDALSLVCAQPGIEPELRAPLVLQTLLGFEAAAIASAFLVSPAAMSQRLVRAKKRLREAGLRLRAPARAEVSALREAVRKGVHALLTRQQPRGVKIH
jgi:RNA polymerase sigma-70 factor (ECF subfamily)